MQKAKYKVLSKNLSYKIVYLQKDKNDQRKNIERSDFIVKDKKSWQN